MRPQQVSPEFIKLRDTPSELPKTNGARPAGPSARPVPLTPQRRSAFQARRPEGPSKFLRRGLLLVMCELKGLLKHLFQTPEKKVPRFINIRGRGKGRMIKTILLVPTLLQSFTPPLSGGTGWFVPIRSWLKRSTQKILRP